MVHCMLDELKSLTWFLSPENHFPAPPIHSLSLKQAVLIPTLGPLAAAHGGQLSEPRGRHVREASSLVALDLARRLFNSRRDEEEDGHGATVPHCCADTDRVVLRGHGRQGEEAAGGPVDQQQQQQQ